MSQPQLLFILSTGRSGTTSIASLLSTVPGAVIEHERRPKLLEEAIDFRRGRMTKIAMVDLLRATRDPSTFRATSLAGESNQRLSFVLPALAEAFPTAKYVLLHRDGREVIDSLHHRWWYHPREAALRHPTLRTWASTRFEGPDFGMPLAEWSRMSPFARCAWYWALVPALVRREAAQLGLPLLEIRLEDLSGSPETLEAFLMLPKKTLTAPPRANATHGSRASWRSWSPKMRRDFERYSGAEMDHCYPGWRGEFVWSAKDEAKCLVQRGAGFAREVKAHVNALLGRNATALPESSEQEGGHS